MDIAVTKRLNSLVNIKKKLKELKLDDPIRFSPIEELNGYFNRYIHGEDIFTTIEFPEFNRNISVKLHAKYPEKNKVLLVKQSLS